MHLKTLTRSTSQVKLSLCQARQSVEFSVISFLANKCWELGSSERCEAERGWSHITLLEFIYHLQRPTVNRFDLTTPSCCANIQTMKLHIQFYQYISESSFSHPIEYITRLITEPPIITLTRSTLRILPNHLKTNTIPFWTRPRFKGRVPQGCSYTSSD